MFTREPAEAREWPLIEWLSMWELLPPSLSVRLLLRPAVPLLLPRLLVLLALLWALLFVLLWALLTLMSIVTSSSGHQPENPAFASRIAGNRGEPEDA